MNRLIASLAFAVVLFATLAAPSTAQAHVLATDDTGQSGAILHIVPDDDPIAGEQASLYFDIQDSAQTGEHQQAALKITDDNGQTSSVPLSIAGNTMTAFFTFPARGTYTIALQVTGGHDNTVQTRTYTHTQRVSRGASGSALDKPSHTWAEALLIFSGCGLIVLLMLAYNRRKDILRSSRI